MFFALFIYFTSTPRKSQEKYVQDTIIFLKTLGGNYEIIIKRCESSYFFLLGELHFPGKIWYN